MNKYRSGKRTIPQSHSETNDLNEKNTDKQNISPNKDSQSHKKAISNDFTIFLNNSASKKDELISPIKTNLEVIKKQESSKLLKEGDDKGKSKDLMKKINALKNRKTQNQGNN